MENNSRKNASDESDESKTNFQVCRKFKKLIKELECRKEELCDPNNDELIEKLNAASLISDKAKGTVEALWYSKFVDLAAVITERKVKNISTTQVRFDPTIYHTKLNNEVKNEMGDNDDDNVFNFWSTIAKFTNNVWTNETPSDLTLPFSEFSYDQNINASSTKKKSATSNGCEVVIPVKELDPEVRTLDNEGETDQIQKILNVITALYRSDPTPIDYFELVTNPNSFSKTIENMFHLSFLAKTGKVRIIHDANMLLVVELCASSTPTRPIVNRGPTFLTKAKWREICRIFELEDTEPLIPL